MVIGPGWWKRWPSVVAPHATPSISTGTISSPSSATIAVQRPHPAQRAVAVDAAPQRIDLGQGKSRTIAATASASTSLVARPGLSITANQMPSRSSSWSCASARSCLQEAFERLRRRTGPRALQLLAHRLGRLRQSARDQRQPPRRRDRSRCPRSSARPRSSSSANIRARSLRARACIRAGISSRQQFEQEVGAHASYPLCAIHAPQAPFARSRTRPI